MPLPQQGLQAEAERGREGGKKREKPRFLREGGEERKRRKTSPETEIVTERQRKGQGDMSDRETDLETHRWGERPLSS